MADVYARTNARRKMPPGHADTSPRSSSSSRERLIFVAFAISLSAIWCVFPLISEGGGRSSAAPRSSTVGPMQRQPLVAHDTERRKATPTNMPHDCDGEPDQRHDPRSHHTRDQDRVHVRDERYDSRERVSKSYLIYCSVRNTNLCECACTHLERREAAMVRSLPVSVMDISVEW